METTLGLLLAAGLIFTLLVIGVIRSDSFWQVLRQLGITADDPHI